MLLMLLTACTIASFSQTQKPVKKKNDRSTSSVTYTCTMHPEIVSDKPGKCPKCGMKLVKVQPVTYTCRMHPEVQSDKPGKCPKCGMDLVDKKTIKK